VGWEEEEFGELLRHRLIRRMIGLSVTDLLEETARRLEAAAPASVEAVRMHPHNLVAFSPEVEGMNRELKRFLFERLYRHPRVIRMQKKAERVLSQLFEAYVTEPAQLPLETQIRLREVGDVYRVVCDYIAGMTDRFALEEYAKLFDPNERV
jgi:dGTPase